MNMKNSTINLFQNTLTFELPKSAVKNYFSKTRIVEQPCMRMASPDLFPVELNESDVSLFEEQDGIRETFTSFDQPLEGFTPVEIDFCNPQNENFVKRFYNRKLELYFRNFDDIVLTMSGVTKDLQAWIISDAEALEPISFGGEKLPLIKVNRFTLRVRFDAFTHSPYLLIALDSPMTLLNMSLEKLYGLMPETQFDDDSPMLSASMLNLVLTSEEREDDNGLKYVKRRVAKLQFLQEKNLPCSSQTTKAFLNRDLKRYFGCDAQPMRDSGSKYVKYFEKISWFKEKYLKSEDLREAYINLAEEFTSVDESHVGHVEAKNRMLVFGGDKKSMYQNEVATYGPAVKCPYKDIKLIVIFHTEDRDMAQLAVKAFREGFYRNVPLHKFLGLATPVSCAEKPFHIEFHDRSNPVPEIRKALESETYENLSANVEYLGLYFSPIPKYNSGSKKECYDKVKEMFEQIGIHTQCIDVKKMRYAFEQDKKKAESLKENSEKYEKYIPSYAYSFQNMSVAICAKLCGAPWILDVPVKNELVIGIGAFRSKNAQYIGAAFAFNNRGVFNSSQYFQKNELDELIGSIRLAVINYAKASGKPERLIIHYYKKLSIEGEMKKLEEMLHSLELDIPIYVVTINKTESNDNVVFDSNGNYTDYQGTHKSLMPKSGTFVDLGKKGTEHRFLLCNNSDFGDNKFKSTYGFPFPVKLSIYSSDANIDDTIIEQLITQVFQFSLIYWKSTRQQGLPVTIKYPEMIAEIMPHFESKTIYAEPNSMWFI